MRKFFEKPSYSKEEYKKKKEGGDWAKNVANEMTEEYPEKAKYMSFWNKFIDTTLIMSLTRQFEQAEKEIKQMEVASEDEAIELNKEYSRLLEEARIANQALITFQKEKLGMDMDTNKETTKDR